MSAPTATGIAGHQMTVPTVTGIAGHQMTVPTATGIAGPTAIVTRRTSPATATVLGRHAPTVTRAAGLTVIVARTPPVIGPGRTATATVLVRHAPTATRTAGPTAIVARTPPAIRTAARTVTATVLVRHAPTTIAGRIAIRVVALIATARVGTRRGAILEASIDAMIVLTGTSVRCLRDWSLRRTSRSFLRVMTSRACPARCEPSCGP